MDAVTLWLLQQLGVRNMTAFRVWTGATTTLPSGSSTVLNLNAVTENPRGDYDTVNKKYVAPVTGYYAFQAQIGVPASYTSGDRVTLAIVKNGSTTLADAQFVKNGSVYEEDFSISVLAAKLSAGDYVQVLAFQDGVANLVIASSQETNFSGGLR